MRSTSELSSDIAALTLSRLLLSAVGLTAASSGFAKHIDIEVFPGHVAVSNVEASRAIDRSDRASVSPLSDPRGLPMRHDRRSRTHMTADAGPVARAGAIAPALSGSGATGGSRRHVPNSGSTAPGATTLDGTTVGGTTLSGTRSVSTDVSSGTNNPVAVPDQSASPTGKSRRIRPRRAPTPDSERESVRPISSSRVQQTIASLGQGSTETRSNSSSSTSSRPGTGNRRNTGSQRTRDTATPGRTNDGRRATRTGGASGQVVSSNSSPTGRDSKTGRSPQSTGASRTTGTAGSSPSLPQPLPPIDVSDVSDMADMADMADLFHTSTHPALENPTQLLALVQTGKPSDVMQDIPLQLSVPVQVMVNNEPGQPTPPVIQTVPEPSTRWLIAISVLALLLLPHRRRLMVSAAPGGVGTARHQ